MSKRDKKRGNRRQQIRPTSAADQSSQPETTTSSESAEQRRARQKKEWEDRKHRKDLSGKLQVPLIGTTTIGSLVGGATSLVVVIGSIIGVFLLLSGGGGDGAPAVTATPDPRVAGLPIAKTVDISADDDGQAINPRFIPNVVTGEAGTVIEFKITNDGSVAHNLNVSGLDKEYGTRDDFVIDSLQPGEEATLLVKLDDPGTYPFRCDLHPEQQTGTLILS